MCNCHLLARHLPPFLLPARDDGSPPAQRPPHNVLGAVHQQPRHPCTELTPGVYRSRRDPPPAAEQEPQHHVSHRWRQAHALCEPRPEHALRAPAADEPPHVLSRQPLVLASLGIAYPAVRGRLQPSLRPPPEQVGRKLVVYQALAGLYSQPPVPRAALSAVAVVLRRAQPGSAPLERGGAPRGEEAAREALRAPRHQRPHNVPAQQRLPDGHALPRRVRRGQPPVQLMPIPLRTHSAVALAEGGADAVVLVSSSLRRALRRALGCTTAPHAGLVLRVPPPSSPRTVYDHGPPSSAWDRPN